MYSIGLDFGSTAVRALIVDFDKCTELAGASTDYPCGIRGVCQKEDDPLFARQDPAAYLSAMTDSIIKALSLAKTIDPSFDVTRIAGIGVDATSSTIIPVTQDMTPLAFLDSFKDDLDAFSWMWKDHTGIAEAAEITSLAQKQHIVRRPQLLLERLLLFFLLKLHIYLQKLKIRLLFSFLDYYGKINSKFKAGRF